MKRDVRDRWIAALRSGEHEQGQGRLRDGRKFCCLGVLCDLAAKDGVAEWQSDVIITPTGGSHWHLPVPIIEWAGLADPRYDPAGASTSVQIPRPAEVDQEIGDNDDCVTLADLNDMGWTFDRIADVIEREL